MMELEELALAVDEHLDSMTTGRDPARLFGVRVDTDGLVLLSLWSGIARELPGDLAPAAGLRAIALETTGWASPMDEGRPSQHPLRRRIHQTVLIAERGVDVSVLRYEDGEPRVLRGAVGVVLALLVACWARRADAMSSIEGE